MSERASSPHPSSPTSPTADDRLAAGANERAIANRADERERLAGLYRDHIDHLERAYSAALEASGYRALVIHAGVERKRDPFDDQYWPLQPTPTFTHWVPWARPEAAVIVRPGDKPRLVYPPFDNFWDSEATPASNHFAGSFEHITTADPSAVRDLLAGDKVAFIGSHEPAASDLGVASGDVNPKPLITALDAVRSRKTAYERHCMAVASARAARGHVALAERFAAGSCSELALHLAYLDITEQDDADTPYKNIVALGEHASVLHHVRYSCARVDTAESSLLVDAGATYLGYASDITRTYVRGKGAAADSFAGLIAGVTALQQELCRRAVPGLMYETLHDQAHELLAALLCDLGVARASAEALVESGATRAFLPHGLGHSLGIQVHDVGCRPTEPRPDNRFLRNTSRIEVGQVFTIEPGCYFIDSLLAPLREQPIGADIDWQLVAALTPFGGVRIEDNLAVDEPNAVNLTRDNWPTAP